MRGSTRLAVRDPGAASGSAGLPPTGFTLLEGVIAMGILSSALIVGLALAISNLNAATINSDRLIASHLAREGIEVMRNIRDSNWMRRGENIDKDPGSPGTQFYNSISVGGAQQYWIDYFDGWPTHTAPALPLDNYGRFFDIYLTSVPPGGTEYMYELHKVTSADGPAPDLLSCIQNGNESCRVKKRGSVYFQSGSGLGAGEEYTNFYRRMYIKDICHSDSSGNDMVINDLDNALEECPLDLVNGIPMTKIGHLVVSQVIWVRGDRILELEVKERLYQWR